MKPYQSTNKISNSGFSWLILSSLLGGLAVGGITLMISLTVYLVLVFPAGMGLVSGVIMGNAIHRGKVRNPFLAVTFGAIAGLITYGTVHGGEYLLFRSKSAQEILTHIGEEYGKNVDASVNHYIDTYLQQKTGSTGFLGYLKYNAKQGVSIGRVGREEEATHLDETFTWLYWLVELAIIEGIIIAIAYQKSREPFCEDCDQWYRDPKRLGNVRHGLSDNFLNLLQQNKFTKAGELIDPVGIAYIPSLEVQLQGCAQRQMHDSVLTVYKTDMGMKGQTLLKQVSQYTISPSETSKILHPLPEYLDKPEQSNLAEVDPISWGTIERTQIQVNNQFVSHGLSQAEVDRLVQKLSGYRQLKAAYLVRKLVQYFPEKPLYVLGIDRRKAWLESEITDHKFVNRLATELDLPNQTAIVPLNQDKNLKAVLQKIPDASIYSR